MTLAFDVRHTGVPRLTRPEARELAERARRVCGVSIDPGKLSFLELRVGRRLRELGCADFADYVTRLDGPEGAVEALHLAEMITTHTTSFFREKAHYDWLETEGLPSLVAEGAGRAETLTIWSAACSLGSEMWSAAMVIDQFARRQPGNLSWQVIGTDISRRILRRASTGLFEEGEIDGLSEELRRAYLLRARHSATSVRSIGGRALYRIAPELRSRARFFWLNLLEPATRFRPVVDVVFLRNVLFYFEAADRARAVRNVIERLRPGGYLLMGHSEILTEMQEGLVPVRASIYRKEER